ncbi:hypothetical protein AHiyo4_17780 [Arthrobacter sp. Hiyo4]|nr:hypothetical protein AHiyo4_17780 [Arthrobacter sp. Hiyo4]
MSGKVRRRDVQQFCCEPSQGTPASDKNGPWAGCQGGSAGQLGGPSSTDWWPAVGSCPSDTPGGQERRTSTGATGPASPAIRIRVLALDGAEALCSQGNRAFARSRGLIGRQRPVRCPETQAEGE